MHVTTFQIWEEIWENMFDGGNHLGTVSSVGFEQASSVAVFLACQRSVSQT